MADRKCGRIIRSLTTYFINTGICRNYLQIAVPILILCVVNVNVSVDTSMCVTDVDRVLSCPKTKEEWIVAAKRKNCATKIAKYPKCAFTDPPKYHCLPNAWRNATYELCGVDTEIIGLSCAEYNEGGKLIQPNHGNLCKDFEPSCPFKYNSSTAYIYNRCYEILHTDLRTEETLSDPQSGYTTVASVTTTKTGDEMSLLFIVTPFLVLLLILMAIPMYITKKYVFKRWMHKEDNRETTEEITAMV